jgi:molybdopterin converting factor small subunit
MKVTVMFAPLFNEEVGIRECTIEVEEGADLNRLFKLLIERYGDVFKEVALAASKHSGILVLRNSQIVINMGEALRDGDKISFAIPLSGG